MPERHPSLLLDPGLMAYGEAHRLQLDLVEARIADSIPDTGVLLEHPAVFTLGRRGSLENLKVPPSFLAEAGIQVHRIERGGDITYHGPGQLVFYPIFLIRNSLGITSLVDGLEEAMIRTAGHFGIPAARDPRNRGVWAAGKKLGSIGLSVRRGVSFHGLALNVSTSLAPFSWINPCGLHGVTATSMALESGRDLPLGEVKGVLRRHLEAVFHMAFKEISLSELKGLMPHGRP